MVRTASVFSQVLGLIDRQVFERLVREHQTEYAAKGFSSWDQFVAMLFCQFAHCESLREICAGLASCGGKLRHFGLEGGPKRSTLSYANRNRPWELYRSLFFATLEKVQEHCGGKRRFRFRNKLFSVDASVIELCASIFDWAHFQRVKGGAKLHLVLEHETLLPVFAEITAADTPDVKVAHRLRFPPNSLVVMDRGYFDFSLFKNWDDAGVYFVTRLKGKTRYEIVEEYEVPQNRNILRDCLVEWTGCIGRRKKPPLTRLIEVWDPEQERSYTLLTNHRSFGASTIAKIYKDRWQIELFFKAIKQNLKLRSFVGTSYNAVSTQIWTALIATLLLKYIQRRVRARWSLSNLVAMLRLNLLTHKNLWPWLEDPLQNPARPPGAMQLRLPFPHLGQLEGGT